MKNFAPEDLKKQCPGKYDLWKFIQKNNGSNNRWQRSLLIKAVRLRALKYKCWETVLLPSFPSF